MWGEVWEVGAAVCGSPRHSSNPGKCDRDSGWDQRGGSGEQVIRSASIPEVEPAELAVG